MDVGLNNPGQMKGDHRQVLTDVSRGNDGRISDRLIELCMDEKKSVSSVIGEELKKDGVVRSPGEVWEGLFGKKGVEKLSSENGDKRWKCLNGEEGDGYDELERGEKCGKWGGKKPGELFLKIYHDALSTLEEDLGRGVVSPCLMGGSGFVKLTVISVMPDIVRHMSNVIARAEREVFLATNYWQDSVASKYITNALRELNLRAGHRRTKVVVKIIYDRGSPKQLFEPHYLVGEKEYTGTNVNLPHPSEVPNLEMQVMNYHTPLVGTFHAKYVVVDRKIALLQSNNIQDNDNLEMLVHLEGPIVDSFWDMVLISWHRKLEPPLPSCESNGNGHAVGDEVNSGLAEGLTEVKIQEANGMGNVILPEHTSEDPQYDDTIEDEVTRIQSSLSPKPNETHLEAVTRLLNHTVNKNFSADRKAPPCLDRDYYMTPYIPSCSDTPVPMALVNRAPYGPPSHKSLSNPQNAAWLSALRNAKNSVFIQSPTLNAEPLLPAIIEACERGIDVTCYICLGYNDAGEILPHQNGHNGQTSSYLHSSLSPKGKTHLHWYWYVAKDQTKPLVQSKKLRSCHIKLMIVDGRIGIMGNGNQDTQSWFHSQEINVMVDSKEVCEQWMEGIERNQNTRLFGRVDKEDGIWRDEEGKEAEGAMAVDVGKFGWVKGVVGAVKRVRGVGGF
ncbi:minor cardiolipin synthase ClsB [Podospora fimiseda]|uniref:Minor cardiolipin synthase ClsB n=1 Tax=Podospora fimiseda TaxID=252190 RepID=A0AAN7BS71_9PEZI|nr:minor cardiolipin synthase ClsB [Podospora fimiseda]